MAETDAKRNKIDELLAYIETRLAELEEEKEELKEFQEKDKERRCLEYAMWQHDLEEATAALEELEEEHRGDVHSANVRREQFNDREKNSKAGLSVRSLFDCADNIGSIPTDIRTVYRTNTHEPHDIESDPPGHTSRADGHDSRPDRAGVHRLRSPECSRASGWTARGARR